MMKTLFAFCLLSTTAVFAQYVGGSSTLSSQPQIYEAPSHPAHASYTAMSAEQSILASSSYSAASGDRPVSDFPQPEPVSLGTAARDLKKEHVQAKKSHVIWVNQ